MFTKDDRDHRIEKIERAVIDTALAVARAKEAWILARGQGVPSSYYYEVRRNLAMANAANHLAEAETEHMYAVRNLMHERGPHAGLSIHRTPEGDINNCALANGAKESDCQMCKSCPDRERFGK